MNKSAYLTSVLEQAFIDELEKNAAIPFLGAITRGAGKVMSSIKSAIRVPSGPGLAKTLGSRSAVAAKPVATKPVAAAPAAVAAAPKRIAAADVKTNTIGAVGLTKADVAANKTAFTARRADNADAFSARAASIKANTPRLESIEAKNGIAPAPVSLWNKIKNHPAALPVAVGAGALAAGGMIGHALTGNDNQRN